MDGGIVEVGHEIGRSELSSSRIHMGGQGENERGVEVRQVMYPVGSEGGQGR